MVDLTNVLFWNILPFFILLSTEELVGWKVHVNAADAVDEKFFHACSGGEIDIIEQMLRTSPCK